MPLETKEQARSRQLAAHHRKTPPCSKQKRRTKRVTRVTNLDQHRAVHDDFDRRLQTYLDEPRQNYHRLTPDLRALVSPKQADYLHPCNATARFRFARIIQEEVERFGIASMVPLVWVTIAPGCFALPIAEAHTIKLASLRATIQQALGSIPFVAIIEAGHYRASPHMPSPLVIGRDLKARRSDMVSWHVHLITFGHTERQVRAALAGFRARHKNMVGRDCVHVEAIGPNDVAFKMLYASKGQLKSYRHYLAKDISIDYETGELTRTIKQSKEPMRTGDHVRMIEVFNGLWLDELIFGQGIGTTMAHVVRCRAMMPLCREATRAIEREPRDRAHFLYLRKYRALAQKLRRKHGITDLDF